MKNTMKTAALLLTACLLLAGLCLPAWAEDTVTVYLDGTDTGVTMTPDQRAYESVPYVELARAMGMETWYDWETNTVHSHGETREIAFVLLNYTTATLWENGEERQVRLSLRTLDGKCYISNDSVYDLFGHRIERNGTVIDLYNVDRIAAQVQNRVPLLAEYFEAASLSANHHTDLTAGLSIEAVSELFGLKITGGTETRAAIDAVCAAFRLPTCTRRFPRDIGKERPCLNYHMGRCDGFCRGEPDAEEYQKRIEQACSLLSGHYKTLARELKTEMEHEAEQLHFEQAAVLRDRIAAIEVLGKRQKVIAGVCADTDVWGLYTGAAKSGCAVVHVEDGSVTGRETSIFTAPTDETEADTLSALLSQYYLPRGVLPREILLPFAVDELSGLETVLTSRAGHRVTLRVPQRGEKAELLAMAERNAREEVERVTTAAEREDKTLRSLAAMCGLSAAPKRMESYDISNTGASDIVASMVVYAGARPLKRDYRRFKMKSVTAHPDDYASMEEVLTRRLQRYADGDEKFAPLPDVFLIDGGMTHAAVAEKVCAAFGLRIPIFGMVKDDRHRTRALTTAEGHEIDLHADPAVFALIGQIQEETHRFAITYHHESHTRSSVASALDGIPNIGEVRKRKLLARFKSVKAIREVELPALQSELGRAAGRAVYDHFHPKEETP